MQQSIHRDAPKGQRKASPGLADHVGGRHPAALQHDVSRVGLSGHRLVARLHPDTGLVQVDEEGCHFALRRIGGRRRHQHRSVGKGRARDEPLTPRDHELIALAHRLCLNGTRVRTRLRLSQREANGFFGAGDGQDVAIKLIGGRLARQRPDPGRSAEFAQHMRCKRRAAGIDCLLDQRVIQCGQTGTAQLFRQRHPIETQLARTLPHRAKRFAARTVLMIDPLRLGQFSQFTGEEFRDSRNQVGCLL